MTFFTAAMFTSAINYLAGAASSVAGGSAPPIPSIPGDPSGISQDDPLVKKYLNHLSFWVSDFIRKSSGVNPKKILLHKCQPCNSGSPLAEIRRLRSSDGYLIAKEMTSV